MTGGHGRREQAPNEEVPYHDHNACTRHVYRRFVEACYGVNPASTNTILGDILQY